MSLPLLATKLYIPPLRSDAVSRPHLLRILKDGLDQPGNFALISGPPGFGKTTLLGEFSDQRGGKTAWISLDEGDNDPSQFWMYLVAACQTVLPAIAESAAIIFHSPQPLPGEAIATMIINAIAGAGSDLTLVLDDYHVIQNEEIHAAIVFLLEHLPDKLHVIVSTRIDPPWPLARFRVRNRLVEIRAQDLRFSEPEAAEFLHRMLGMNLPSRDVSILEERTEGWAAGLQLAALSMKGRKDISGFVHAFKGSHMYIAEYLVEEVLKRQSKEVQAFLLQSSILKQMNAQLCEAVTGCANGQVLLTALYRDNLFIVSLDDQGEWFRYHHLFADLLKARLNRDLPKAEIGALHQRAAEWYERFGMVSDAIDHALASEDYPRAVRLIEYIALPMILQAHVRTVERWLQAMPEVWISQSPRLNMAFAWMNLLRGTYHQAIPFITRLRDIFSQLEKEKLSPSLQGEWLALQAELLIAQGKPEDSRDLANQALLILPDVDMNVRSMIYITLAKAFQLTYDYDRAAEIFQMIVRDARHIGDPIFEILGISGEAQMVLKQGRLRRTFELTTGLIHRLEISNEKIPFSATVFGELGQVYYQWHDLEKARIYLSQSVDASGKSGYSDPEIYHHIMLSKMLQVDGELEAAVLEMQKAADLAEKIPPAMVRANIIAQQIRIDLAMGHVLDAEQVLLTEGFVFGDSIQFPNLVSGTKFTYDAGLLYNSALRVLLFKTIDMPDTLMLRAGIDVSGQVLNGELECQHLPIALETLLLRSQMYAALGEHRLSLEEVSRALELAEAEGFLSVFIEEGKPVQQILTALIKSGLPQNVRPEYVHEILALFPHPSGQTEASSQSRANVIPGNASLAEPLTARELEVLRLVAAGDSNQAISEKLFITVSAVKKHTTNIFGKLNVNSRTQAVAYARQLGLLPIDA